MAKQNKSGSGATDKPAKEKKAKVAKDPALKGFGFTLRGAAGDTMRVQSKFKGASEINASVTHTTRNAEGEKARKIGARQSFTGENARAEAEAWMGNVKTKLTSIGWQEKGGRRNKTDAFDLESLPAPAASAPAAE